MFYLYKSLKDKNRYVADAVIDAKKRERDSGGDVNPTICIFSIIFTSLHVQMMLECKINSNRFIDLYFIRELRESVFIYVY